MNTMFGAIFGGFVGLILLGIALVGKELWDKEMISRMELRDMVKFTAIAVGINLITYILTEGNQAREDAYFLAIIPGIFLGVILRKINLIRAYNRRQEALART